MASLTDVDTLLVTAGTLIADRGLCTEAYCADETSDSTLCMVGALNVALGVAAWDMKGAERRGAWRVYGAVADSIGLLPNDDGQPSLADLAQHLASWSDRHVNEPEAVVRALIDAKNHS